MDEVKAGGGQERRGRIRRTQMARQMSSEQDAFVQEEYPAPEQGHWEDDEAHDAAVGEAEAGAASNQPFWAQSGDYSGYYHRPSNEDELSEGEMAFAPPPKFSLPGAENAQGEMAESKLFDDAQGGYEPQDLEISESAEPFSFLKSPPAYGGESPTLSSKYSSLLPVDNTPPSQESWTGENSLGDAVENRESVGNVYRPRTATWADTARRKNETLRRESYLVEEAGEALQKEKGKLSGKKLGIIILCAALLLGISAYVGRGWFAGLSGEETLPGTAQTNQAMSMQTVKGYDPAAAVKLNEKAEKGITAVSGALEMEYYAITSGHVVGRVQTAAGLYDFYLFSAADGRLLGYFEGLSENGMVVQPAESFYIEQSPYLLDKQGKPLLNTSRYIQYVGQTPVLSAFENGWAIIQNEAGTQFNYINREGELLSKLWFARVFPFYGDYTVAYVDTGNVSAPEERYALYVLNADGSSERWQYTDHMQGVVGAAQNAALMQNGDLISLRDTNQVICRAEAAVVYVDCDAMAVRDEATGKYGLFVGGEQRYGFEYDSIAPVPCDMRWMQEGDVGFVVCAVTGAAYPQPLTHYFTLNKGGGEEMVALSTRSVYAVVLK